MAPPTGWDHWEVSSLHWDLPTSLMAVGLAAAKNNATSPSAATPTHGDGKEGEEEGVGVGVEFVEEDLAPALVQLYYRENYHWYLKQQWVGRGLLMLGFDAEAPNRMYLSEFSKLPLTLASDSTATLGDGGGSSAAIPIMRVVEFAWDICASSTSDGSVAVVDGVELQLTPLATHTVPPPMSMYTEALRLHSPAAQLGQPEQGSFGGQSGSNTGASTVADVGEPGSCRSAAFWTPVGLHPPSLRTPPKPAAALVAGATVSTPWQWGLAVLAHDNDSLTLLGADSAGKVKWRLGTFSIADTIAKAVTAVQQEGQGALEMDGSATSGADDFQEAMTAHAKEMMSSIFLRSVTVSQVDHSLAVALIASQPVVHDATHAFGSTIASSASSASASCQDVLLVLHFRIDDVSTTMPGAAAAATEAVPEQQSGVPRKRRLQRRRRRAYALAPVGFHRVVALPGCVYRMTSATEAAVIATAATAATAAATTANTTAATTAADTSVPPPHALCIGVMGDPDGDAVGDFLLYALPISSTALAHAQQAQGTSIAAVMTDGGVPKPQGSLLWNAATVHFDAIQGVELLAMLPEVCFAHQCYLPLSRCGATVFHSMYW